MNRYDYVGSFLRPERLKKARRDFENNTIKAEELKKVEDECITELITKIKELGYKFVAKNPHACVWDESHISLDIYLEK